MEPREHAHTQAVPGAAGELQRFTAAGLGPLLSEPLPSELSTLLTGHIRSRRWFRGKARPIEDIKIVDHVPLGAEPHELQLAIVRVRYLADPPELYVMPLALAAAGDARVSAPLFELTGSAGARAWVYDPTGGQQLSSALLQLLLRPHTQGHNGHVVGQPSQALVADLSIGTLPARVPSGEQSNTSVFYGQTLTLKLFRLLETGENPDVEINQFLWGQGYRNVPEPLGSMRYERDGFVATLGIIQRFVPSQGTAWDVTLQLVERSFEAALALGGGGSQLQAALPSADLLESSAQTPPASIASLVGPYAPLAKLLGRRTAELHLALGASEQNPAFRPEPMTREDQRALVRNTRERITRNYELLSRQLPSLPPSAALTAAQLLAGRDQLSQKLDVAASTPCETSLIRCHGDYHLGQVLYDGEDFTLLDFEGEPAQPIEVRRLKRSALYDVCGMLRSFHYAATFALHSPRWTDEQRTALGGWAELWYRWTSALFLGAYLGEAHANGRKAAFLPQAPDQLRALLPLHMIDKCSYELGYELNNRPDWVGVPLAGLVTLTHSP